MALADARSNEDVTVIGQLQDTLPDQRCGALAYDDCQKRLREK
jgi:hypothetical protein